MSSCLLCLMLSQGLALQPMAERSFLPSGSDAPTLELKAVDGGPFTSKSLKGEVWVLVFLRPGQPESLKTLKELKALERELPGAAWKVVGIVSGAVAPPDAGSLAREAEFAGTLLLDPDRSAYARLGVIAVPSLAVIDGDSKVIYSRPGYGKDLSTRVRHHLSAALGLVEPSTDGPPRPLRTAPKLALARGLLAQGGLDRAEKIVSEAISEEPTAEGFALWSDIHLRRKEPLKALEVLNEATRKLPRDPRLEVASGRALAALGRNEEAEKTLRAAIQTAPSAWEAHLALAELYEQLNKSELAIQEYKSAVQILRRGIEERR